MSAAPAPTDLLSRVGDAIASAWRWLVGAAILGFAPGWTLWALLHADLDQLADNAFTGEQRTMAVRWGLASLLLLLGTYLALWRRARARPLGESTSRPSGPESASRPSWPEFAATLNRRLLLLAGTPLLALLAAPDLATRLGFVALLTCVALGALAAASVAAWPRRDRALSARPLLILVAALTLAVAAVLGWLGVVRHHALLTNIFDLGIFENVLWHSVHGDPLGTTIFPSGNFSSEHFAPLLLLLAPLYALVPRGETLIVAQTVWLCSAVIPLWLWTRRQHASPAVAAALCVAWLLSPFVHSNALWDFHDLTLGVPLVLWALWGLAVLQADGRRAPLWLAASALLLVREEMALVVLMLGLFAALSGERRRGAALMLLALAWFVLVARLLAPGAGLGAYPNSLHGGLSNTSSYGDLSAVLAADPLFLLLELMRPSKFGLLLALLTPLLLLPALAGRILLLLAPGVAILALSANKAVANPAFHYTSFFLPVLFAAAPLGLLRLERWLGRPAAREAVAGILVAALAFNWSFGALGPSTSFRAGFSSISWTLTAAERERHAFVTELATQFEPDACIAATGKVGAHLAGRRCLIRLGDRSDVDWVVILRSEMHARSAPILRAFEDSGEFVRHVEAHGILVLRRVR